jgi:phage baseplate assembly protein W
LAIILNQKNAIDENTNKRIGIDFPFQRGDYIDGYFKSTSLTIDAVKSDLINLLSTNVGERIFQPELGTNLRNFLFEQNDDELQGMIQDDLVEKIRFWMPFVQLVSVDIKQGDDSRGENPNRVIVDVRFILSSNPKNLESVQIDMGNVTESVNNSPIISDLGI